MPTLGLEQGTLDFDTPDFNLKLVKASQTIAALEPKGATAAGETPFDFTPADQLPTRNGDRFNHLGDISIRARTVGADGPGEWRNFATSTARKPVEAIEQSASAAASSGKVLAAADLSPTLPDDCPLAITRDWLLDPTNKLVLHFNIKNKSDATVEIGGLGFPVVFNNMIHD